MASDEPEDSEAQELQLQRGAAVRSFVVTTLPFMGMWGLAHAWLRPELALRSGFETLAFGTLGLIAYRLSRTRWVHAASLVLVCASLGLVFLAAITSSGAHSPAYAAFSAIIAVTGVLLGPRAAALAALVSALAGGVLVWAERHAFPGLDPGRSSTISYWLGSCMTFGTIAAVQSLFSRIASESRARAHSEAESRRIAEQASRRAREQSDQNEQRYREIFQSAAVALFEVDLSGALRWGRARVEAGLDLGSLDEAGLDEVLDLVRVVDVNEAAVQCMDAGDKAALIGAALRTARPRTRNGVAQLIAAVGFAPSRIQRELDVETLQGRHKRLLIDLRLPAPEADWSRIVISVVDVTELRLLEERTRAAERLEGIGRLAGGVAHDFNNALSVIMSWASVLQRPNRGDAQREAQLEAQREQGLNAIMQSAARAAELTRQLLSLGRRDVRAPRPTHVPALIDETVQALSRLLPADITVKVEHGTDEPALVDAGQLQQVLLNLALNARDAMPGGGVLALSTRLVEPRAGHELADLPPQQHIEICVRDTGVGMDAATCARIFEPFFTTKGEGGGTGLGLATAHAVIAQSGGKIAVESQPGKGSAFYVYLPRAPERAARSAPRMAAVQPQRGSTVLLVEDEALVRDVMVQALREAGYRVLEAQDGDEGWRLAQAEHHIDLLCTDGILPGLPTRELIERVSARFAGVPVLVCSGHLQEELVRRQIADGTCAFLAKPFTPSELVSRVATALQE